MNKTIYRQTDNRWRWLPYPNGGYYLNGSGCGCLSVTHCVMEIPKYKNYTPKNTQPYMRQFATRGDGTLRSGILSGLKHWGFTDVRTHNTMSDLWSYLNKGGRVGILLFGGSRGPDGTQWTTGGHYIAFTNYRIKNGQHQLYLKDSGWRHHDGWYTYEKSMRGDVRWVCSGKVPNIVSAKEKYKDSLKKKDYTKKLPGKDLKANTTNAIGTKRWQRFLNWWGDFKLDVNGEFNSKTVKATKLFQEAHDLVADGVVGPKTRAAAKKYLKKEEPKKEETKPTQPTQPVKKKKTKAEIINENAIKLAWPVGTPKKK